MSDELVVPYLLAGRRLDADKTVAVETVSGAMPALVVVGRRADRRIDIAELLVGTHGRPDVRIARLLPGVLLPGFDAGLACCGMVLKVQNCRPVRTSKPRTSPGGEGSRPHQSQTEEPTMMTSRTITGGDVIV